MANKKPRELAVNVLEKIEVEGTYSNLELNAVKKNEDLDLQDHSFLTELVYGVMQNKRLIDYYLNPYLKNPDKMDNWVLQVLRVAVYQMVFLDGVPDYAIINEAVNYANKRGHRGIKSLVNGVLRNVQRHDLNDIGKLKNSVKKIAIPYSLPDWLVEKFIKQFGEEESLQIAKSFNKRSKTSVRINTNRISLEEAKKKLEQDGYSVQYSYLAQDGLIIEKGLPINHSLYQDGLLSIQDESSMLIAPSLSIEAGHKVADVCAAPGGKSSHIATFLDSKKGGILYSSDIHQHKIDLINEMVKRQKFEAVIHTRQLDATKASSHYNNQTFDRILVDAPCSGIGLLRRKPDIRYAKDELQIKELPKLQLDILNEVAPLLKEGGEIVYSTCTILDEENGAVINQFLNQNQNFKLKKIPIDIKEYEDNNGEITILPHHFDSDGFYIASLIKIAGDSKIRKD